MLRYLLVLISLLPSFVFAQQLTDSQLATQLLTLIPNNTSNAITPANVRKVTQDGYDARISVYGNLGIKGLLGYNTLYTLTNDKQLAHKKYVDDKFASINTSDFINLTQSRAGFSAPDPFFNYNAANGILGISYVPLSNALPTGKIFIGNSSNLATPQTPSGEVSVSQTGVFTLSNKNATGTMGSSNIQFPTELTIRNYINSLGFYSGEPPVSDELDPIFNAQGVKVAGTYTDPAFLVSLSKSKIIGLIDPVQSDWNAASGLAQILNKPTIPAAQVSSDWTSLSGVSRILNKPTLSLVATTGNYSDLIGKPSIPSGQVNSDWNAVSGISQILNKPSIPAGQVPSDWSATTGITRILNKPSLAAVATSGAYGDLSGKPTIPAAQVNVDWSAASGITSILNKPNLSVYELNSNKVTSLLSPNNITYPTTKAVQDALDTLAANISITGGVVPEGSDPIYITGTGSGTCILRGSDGAALLGSDGLPLLGPCGGFVINVKYADSLNAGVITASKYRYISNLDAYFASLLGSYANPSWITSLAKSKITGLIDPVNPDWNASSGLAQILNKPVIPAAQQPSDWSAASGVTRILNKPTFGAVAFSNSYTDLSNKPTIPAAQLNSDWAASSGVTAILNKPSIPAQLNAIQGANMTITGTYPNLTFSSSGAGQVNADWNATSGIASILNKPSLSAVATSGDYNNLINRPSIPASQVNSDWSASSGITSILNKPTIPAAQVNSDWTATSGITRILNKPSFVAVATTGDYNDLINKPTIAPGQVNADWNASSGISQILNKPTNLSSFANGPGYISASSANTLTNKSGNISQWTNNVGYLTATTISGLYIPLTGTIAGHDVTGPINWQDGVNGGTGMSIGEKFSSGESMITFYDPSLLEIHGKIFMSSLIGSDIDTPWSLEIQNFDRFNFGEGQFVYSGDYGLTIRSTPLSGGTSFNRSRINFEALDLSQHISLGLQDSIVDQYDVNFPRNQPTNNSAWGYKDGKYKWLPMSSGGGGGITTESDPVFSSTGALKATTISINGVTQSLASNRSWTIPSASSAGSAFSIQLADGSGGFANDPNLLYNTSTAKLKLGGQLYAGYTGGTLTGNAWVNVNAGSTTKAGLYIGNGPLLSSPQNYHMENDGSHLYFTIGSARRKLDDQLSDLTTTQINSLYGYTPANAANTITSLTTTGTSGPATFSSGVLNIPQYAGGGSGITSFGAVGSSPSPNGATVSGTTATLQPFNSSNPGIMTTGAQNVPGRKTFDENIFLGVLTTSTNGNILTNYRYVLVNATSASLVKFLPNAVGNGGMSISVKKIDSSSNTVTVSTSGGTIDGLTTTSLTTQYQSKTFFSDGTNWFIQQ